MSLHYRLHGLPCVFCERPVDRLVVYRNAVVTVHQSQFQPPCVFVRGSCPEPPASGVVDEIPRSPTSLAGSTRRAA